MIAMSFSRSEHYGRMSIPELLEALDTHAQAGSDTYQFIQNVLLAQSAKAVNDGLIANAQAVGNATVAFAPKLDRLNQELGETKAKIETAGKKISDVVDNRAQEIGADLQKLSAALVSAATEFQAASAQSSRLGRRLNWLTAALVFAAILTAGATAFQAIETKRQTDLTESQLRRPSLSPAPSTPVPAKPPKP
jgi:hypothetical protein